MFFIQVLQVDFLADFQFTLVYTGLLFLPPDVLNECRAFTQQLLGECRVFTPQALGELECRAFTPQVLGCTGVLAAVTVCRAACKGAGRGE